MNYVKVGCQILNLPTLAFDAELIKKAAVAITKRNLFTPRPKFFIRLPLVRQLMELARKQGDELSAMLYTPPPSIVYCKVL